MILSHPLSPNTYRNTPGRVPVAGGGRIIKNNYLFPLQLYRFCTPGGALPAPACFDFQAFRLTFGPT